MNEDKLLEKIQKLIKDEVRPVKEIVEVVKQKIDGQDLYQRSTSNSVRSIKEQQSVMNEKLDGIHEQAVKLTEDLFELGEDVDAIKVEIHDVHQELGANKDKTISELDKIKEHIGLPTSINS